MLIDVVTIFPDYFAPLELSLIGKARRAGLLDIRVHDLRDFARDRHRTVDDTPCGGGAGMVMRPEPWGQAFEHILAGTPAAGGTATPAAGTPRPLVVFPSPAGAVFTQRTAHRLAKEPHLVFGCGRYEGIDERVYVDTARHARVELQSLGDYVLNGGEVAAIAMIEAVCRLVPGVVGNPESLVAESHEDGLLEAPVYTKPASWRGLEVPPVLLGGDHGEVRRWRRRQQYRRTWRVRPDLAAAQVAQAEPGTAGPGRAEEPGPAAPVCHPETVVIE